MKATLFALSALAGAAVATPAYTVLDFAAIQNAATVTQGPPVTATLQTSIYDVATAAAAASTDVSSAVTTAMKKRNLLNLLFGNNGHSATSTSCSKTTSTSSTVKTTSTSSVKITSTSSSAVKATSTSSSSSSASSSSSSTITSAASTSSSAAATSAAASTTTTKEACSVQPDGYGPKVTPDTPEAFLAYTEFHTEAQSATTPSGYSLSFSDLNASTSANSYLGLYTMTTYDVQSCATYCDDTDLCTAFNIYVERDPSIDPTEGVCDDPASITNYKCTLWGSSIDSTTATNAGQWRDQFEVVITGSNGYNQKNETLTAPDANTASSSDSWSTGTQCGSGNGNAAISAPGNTLGSQFFPGPFDVAVCTAYAESQTAYNKKHAAWYNLWTYQPCNSFNAYLVKMNGKPMGTYCTLFNNKVSSSAATYTGGSSGSNTFQIQRSYIYSLKTQLSGSLL